MNIRKMIVFIIKVLGYAGILLLTSMLFKNTIYMDSSNNGMWFIIVALIVVILNSTVKPFLVWITIPITGVTLGLFYPFINLFILKIASLIVGDHFNIYGIWYAVCASILISILNVILDEVILKKIKR
ncbi:MAG: phage holin family protein [Bacilli bacterium]|nr:phage holin family protein [Bacilli bacterium]